MAIQDVIDSIADFERRQAKYEPVSAGLRDLYGQPRRRESGTALDSLVSCILSQNTTDRNSGRAFNDLKAKYTDWQQVVDAPPDEFIEVVRIAGLANQKGPRIQNALREIFDERGEYSIEFLGDLPPQEAKTWLTNLRGVGPKTAAIVLCFGLKMDAFPVDTHVHRVGQRIGFLPKGISADKAHDVMEAMVPPNDYYGFHINLIRHGREICKARSPQCERCPITDYCDYYRKTDDYA